MTRKLRTGVLALAVLLAGLGLAGPVSASDTYADDDESIVVVVDWADAEVANGDSTTLTVNNTDSATTETVDVTVRDAADSESTYWIDYDDLDDVSPADAETIEVTPTTSAEGSVSVDESVAFDGASELEVSDGEGIETELDVDANYSSLPVEVDLTVIGEDEETTLNESTLGSLNGSETQYQEFHPEISGNTSNVTIQVDYVSDGTDPQFDAVETFSADRITLGIFAGGSGRDSMIIIGIGALVVIGLLYRD